MGLRAADVQAALRERFSAPEFAIFFEVPNATGGAAARRADAIAMSLWPSRGLDLHGFEIKVDRRDWLRELKDPTKAEEHARFTDHWWIAAAPDVVKGEELPRGWGLMVLHGSVLRTEREAPKREGVVPTRPFLAALLRAAAAASPAEEAVRAAVERALLEERRAVKRERADAVTTRPLKELLVEHFNRHARPRPPRVLPDLTCEPAFKYVGGKRNLLVQRPDAFPPREQVRRYHETFAGGLAIYFGRYAGVPAVLNDSNRWLMMAYRMLQGRPDALIAALRELVAAYNEWSIEEHEAAGAFYRLQRERFHAPTMEPARRAALFLFLLMSGYNGLYRENQKGRFNVSWAQRKRLKVDEEKFRAAARALQTVRQVSLINFDFEAHLFDHVHEERGRWVSRGRFAVGEGDFVYLDCPYAPVSKTANFAAYQAGGDWRANGKDKLRLVAALQRLGRLYGDSVRWTLSDADTPETRELYREWNIEVVMMARSVNRDGTKRGGVPELLVRNWQA